MHLPAKGEIWFISGEDVGWYCECGGQVIINEPTECPKCGKRLQAEINVNVWDLDTEIAEEDD